MIRPPFGLIFPALDHSIGAFCRQVTPVGGVSCRPLPGYDASRLKSIPGSRDVAPAQIFCCVFRRAVLANYDGLPGFVTMNGLPGIVPGHSEPGAFQTDPTSVVRSNTGWSRSEASAMSARKVQPFPFLDGR